MDIRCICLIVTVWALLMAGVAPASAADSGASTPTTALAAAPHQPQLAPSVPTQGPLTSALPPAARHPGYTAWWALFVIAVSGAFGGFVDGMRSTRTYRVRFGERSADWGSIADALVGMAASVAIFAFAESIFGGGKELQDTVSAWFLVKIAAWGVLSGYAGTKLLDDLSTKSVQKMISDETGKQVSQQLAVGQQTDQIVQEAEQLRVQYLARVAAAGKGVADPGAEQLLQRAILKFRGVLKNDPLHRGAQNGLANALAELGTYYKDQPDADKQLRAAELFTEAIRLQDGIIRQDPAFSKAYYNRACYRAIAAADDQGREQAVEDLRQAIQRDVQWREYARTDPDLAPLHATAYWKSEVAEKTTAAAP
jgi:hypothetical protein